MNVKLGESGIVMSTAFDFDLIILVLKTVIIPALEKKYHDALLILIHILKDKNTTYKYKSDEEAENVFFSK